MLAHCTQGKDRTGQVIALVLMILGVPIDAIEHDYFLTDPALASVQEERLKEIHELGLTDEWGMCAPDLIKAIAKHLQEKYGGLDVYLDGIGFGGTERKRMRDLMLY